MMFSNSRNVELICQIIKDLREYGSLRLERFELDLSQKLALVIGLLVTAGVLCVLALLVLICLSLAVGYAIAPLVGGTVWAMLIISAVYILVAALVYVKREAWIITPLTLFFHDLFIENND